MYCVVTISAPNDVIWKQELYFLILDKKRFDWAVYPVSKVFNGSGGSSSR
ncbi:unnamed protein product, partial [Onchocerca ochengi]|uniref:Uncharacterized protein n=1 Tax=Onchocerca ochengi TaxID=42157 RepID=A0A182EYB1_ONCOC